MVVLWVALALILMTLVLVFAPMPPVLGISGDSLAEITAWLGLVLVRVDSYRRAPARYRKIRLLFDAAFFGTWLGKIVWARLDPAFWRSNRAAVVTIPLFGILGVAWLAAQFVLLRKESDPSSTPHRDGDV